MGVFCGMNLMEHPGPKGQIITAGRIDPFWFTSVRDTVAFTLMPDSPRYQGDLCFGHGARDKLGKSGRDQLDRRRKAFFVIESRKQGGMGAPRRCRSEIARPPTRLRRQWRPGGDVDGNSGRLCARQRRARRPEQHERPDVRTN